MKHWKQLFASGLLAGLFLFQAAVFGIEETDDLVSAETETLPVEAPEQQEEPEEAFEEAGEEASEEGDSAEQDSGEEAAEEELPRNGLFKVDEKWAYYSNGVIDTAFTGLIKDENYGWFYVSEGYLDWDHSGLERYDGGWYNVENGTIRWDYTGLVKDTRYGWFYVKNGMIDWTCTGLERYAGGWFTVENGSLNWNYTGLFKDVRYGWFYVKNGMIDWTYTGLEQYAGGWFAVENGSLNWNYTGLFEDARYGCFYLENGSLNREYTGFADKDEKRCYVEEGTVTGVYTGVLSIEEKKYLIIGSVLADAGAHTVNEKNYLVDEDGVLITGWNSETRIVPEHEEKVILQDYYQTYPYLSAASANTGYTENILVLQKRLNELGYAVPEDGIYSQTVSDAVSDFQLSRNYYGTGIMEGNTWRELFTVTETIPEQTEEAVAFYLPGSGERVENGLATVDGLLRYFKDGYMVTGPQYIMYNHLRYYIDENGAAAESMTDTLNTAKSILDQVGWNLRAAYDWVCANLLYIRMEYPDQLPEGTVDADFYADYGYANHVGNCYVYAACFYQMAYLLGYDAHFVEGYVHLENGSDYGHGWVEIDQNGKTFTFDAEYESANCMAYGFGYGFTYGKTGSYVFLKFKRVN